MFLFFERIPHKHSSIFFLFRLFERSELQAHFENKFEEKITMIQSIFQDQFILRTLQ